MSETSVDAIVCDDCGRRVLVTDGTREGEPIFSYMLRGWVEIMHEYPDDIATTTSHYCPLCVNEYVDMDAVLDNSR